jgi:ATP-dependent RNA helicase CshB
MILVILMYIKEKLEQLGFKTTTPIQDGVFKLFSSKKHLVGLAPTGTGKTHAYLLPILSKINKDIENVQAVILVPTNELVNQVLRMLTDVDSEVKVKAYIGSSDKQREVEWLSKYQPQIVITTPKRLFEYVVELNCLKIQHAKYFVMDEADMMFDYDFLSHIDTILSSMPKAKYMLFSATIQESMEPFIKQYFGQYDLIDTSKQDKLNIEYRLINIKYQNRLEALLTLTKHLNPYLCFIFVSKKENQDSVYEALQHEGLNVISLNASIGVKKRSKIIEDIINLKYQYVVTSDLAARGLDFKISHVIHYDLPHMLEFFFHRSGRTGRMGDSGIVLTFMSVDDHRKIDKIRQKGITFVNYQLSVDGLTKVAPRKSAFAEQDIEAIKKIKKPTRVKPNYKKKNKQKIKKAKQEVRREAYAKNR